MHPRYPHVFSPIALGPVTIPNRFFFAPHGSALSVGTKPSDDLVAYSTERVKNGGCGLVIVAPVARALEGQVSQLFTIGDALAPRMWAAATYEGQMFARLIGEPDAPRDFAQTWFAPDPSRVNPFPADLLRSAN